MAVVKCLLLICAGMTSLLDISTDIIGVGYKLRGSLIDLDLEMGSLRPSLPQIQTQFTGRPQLVKLSSLLSSDLDAMTPAEEHHVGPTFCQQL